MFALFTNTVVSIATATECVVTLLMARIEFITPKALNVELVFATFEVVVMVRAVVTIARFKLKLNPI